MQVKEKKCLKCSEHIGKRYCLRTNKHLCWHCCNDYRIDCLCPPECEYHIKKSVNVNETENKDLAQSFKTDSKAEIKDFLEKSYKLYLSKANPFFDNQIPYLLKDTEEGKAYLIEKFSKQNLDPSVVSIIENHLKIKGIKSDSQVKQDILKIDTAEDIAVMFVNALAEENWDMAADFFASKDTKNKKDERYIRLVIKKLKEKKLIKDLKYFSVLNSGLATNFMSAFCSVELNYDSIISILLTNQGDKQAPVWLVNSIIFGDVSLMFTETDNSKYIASHLGKKEYEKAFKMITQLEEIYPLSPDLHYYKGLYYSMKGQNKLALEAFCDAEILDPFFVEAIYNQAFIYMAENNLEKAKELYEKSVQLKPSNVDALNNLGVICLYEKNFAEAREYFKKCIEIAPDYQYGHDNLKRTDIFEAEHNNKE